MSDEAMIRAIIYDIHKELLQSEVYRYVYLFLFNIRCNRVLERIHSSVNLIRDEILQKIFHVECD